LDLEPNRLNMSENVLEMKRNSSGGGLYREHNKRSNGLAAGSYRRSSQVRLRALAANGVATNGLLPTNELQAATQIAGTHR
jgi:hypothetical protein